MNALARIFDRLHTDTDTAALSAGWTLTRTRWGGRSYRWTAPVPVPATTAVGGAQVIDLAAHRTHTRSIPTSSTADNSGTGTFGGAA